MSALTTLLSKVNGTWLEGSVNIAPTGVIELDYWSKQHTELEMPDVLAQLVADLHYHGFSVDNPEIVHSPFLGFGVSGIIKKKNKIAKVTKAEAKS